MGEETIKIFRSFCLIPKFYEISSSSLLVGPPPVLVSPHGGHDDPASKDGWWLDFQSTERTYFNVETFSFSPSAGKWLSDSRESKGDFSDLGGSWTQGAIFENVSWIIHIGDDINETNKLTISWWLLGGVQIKFHIILLFCGFKSWFSHPMVAMVVFLLPVAAASAAQDAGDQAEQPPEHIPHICHFLHNRNLRPGYFTLKFA